MNIITYSGAKPEYVVFPDRLIVSAMLATLYKLDLNDEEQHWITNAIGDLVVYHPSKTVILKNICP